MLWVITISFAATKVMMFYFLNQIYFLVIMSFLPVDGHVSFMVKKQRMATTYTMRINLCINGWEVRNDIASIRVWHLTCGIVKNNFVNIMQLLQMFVVLREPNVINHDKTVFVADAVLRSFASQRAESHGAGFFGT